MTREERMKAFEMRLDGKTYKEIAAVLGYTRDNVERDLCACVGGRRRTPTAWCPELNEIILTQYYGSIPQFAEACGVSYETMYSFLKKKYISEKTLRAVCKTTGLPEEVFWREEDEP